MSKGPAIGAAAKAPLLIAGYERQLAEAGADVVTAHISVDIAEQLKAGHEVAYSAAETAAAVAMKREAVGDDRIEIGGWSSPKIAWFVPLP